MSFLWALIGYGAGETLGREAGREEGIREAKRRIDGPPGGGKPVIRRRENRPPPPPPTKWQWISSVVLVVGFVSFVVFIGGFPIAKYAVAEAQNDQDCNEWAWDGHNAGPHDEVENPNGCHEVCIDGPRWYKWGSTRHCYYDDGGPTS